MLFSINKLLKCTDFLLLQAFSYPFVYNFTVIHTLFTDNDHYAVNKLVMSWW